MWQQTIKKRRKNALSEAVDEFGATEVVEKVINTPERKSAYLSATIATSEDGPTISNSLALDPELLKEMYRDIKELKKGQKETNRGIEQLSGQIASLSQQIAPCQKLA